MVQIVSAIFFPSAAFSTHPRVSKSFENGPFKRREGNWKTESGFLEHFGRSLVRSLVSYKYDCSVHGVYSEDIYE